MSSELLKMAIADAKAVKLTALANAKAALEEAFTPKLQSMLSQKLQQEIEGEDEAAVEAPIGDDVPADDFAPAPEVSPEVGGIGAAPAETVPVADFGAPAAPEAGVAPVAPEVDPLAGEEELDEYGEGNPDPVLQAELTESDSDADYKKKTTGHKTEDPQGAKIVVKKIEGTKGEPKAQGEPKSAKAGHKTPDPQGPSDEFADGPKKGEKNSTGKVLENAEVGDEDIGAETLEEILSELEAEVNAVGQEAEYEAQPQAPVAEDCGAEATGAAGAAGEDEEINLDEILSEEKDEDEDEDEEEGEKKDKDDNKPAWLKENVSLKAKNQEYLKAIGFLRDRINEVNLLNAKLLYTNRLFKAGSLSREQKIKVIETFDLTKSVREAKLVYATLAESLNFGAAKKPVTAVAQPKKVGAAPAQARAITEGLASKAVASTKPTKQPEILSESSQMANRFKKLAGITK